MYVCMHMYSFFWQKKTEINWNAHHKTHLHTMKVYNTRPVYILTIKVFTEVLQPNSLHRATRFANSEGILGFSVPSIILAHLLGNTCLLVIGAFRTLFLWFKVRFLWSPCFGQWSTSFLRRFLSSFLYLSLARIKRCECLPPALKKNSTHHRDFLRFSWAV